MDDRDLPPPPWRSIRPKRAPARPALSQDEIVDAGLRIIRDEGYDAVSMRRVAAVFGTGASSLYAHVANKDELLQLMFDRICADIPVPEPDPSRWVEQIKQIARDGYRTMIAHGDIARAALATIPTGPNALRVSDGLLGIMLAGRIPPQIAGWALDRLFLYVVADAYEVSLYHERIGDKPAEQATFFENMTTQLAAYYESLPPERYPHVQAHAKALVGGNVGERFEFGLDLIIDGLIRHAERAASD